MQSSYFDALGLAHDGTGVMHADVKRAYRTIATTLHPDKGGNEEHFKLVTAAYNALNDDEKIRQHSRRVAFTMFSPSEKVWAQNYEAIVGRRSDGLKDRVRQANAWDDMDDMIRRTEDLRRQASRARRQAEYDAKFRNHQAGEQARDEQYARQARENRGPKNDRCGEHTSSGPCVRPAGHPHGHMSQTVSDRKKANAKARRDAR